MKEFHPEQLKKLSGTPSKVDLYFDNFELWMTVISAVEQMEQIRSWILSPWYYGFHPPPKTKFFFDFRKLKCHFSKFCLLKSLNPQKIALGSVENVDIFQKNYEIFIHFFAIFYNSSKWSTL